MLVFNLSLHNNKELIIITPTPPHRHLTENRAQEGTQGTETRRSPELRFETLTSVTQQELSYLPFFFYVCLMEPKITSNPIGS